jgi:hypothetical protein
MHGSSKEVSNGYINALTAQLLYISKMIKAYICVLALCSFDFNFYENLKNCHKIIFVIIFEYIF